ncbi:MAG: hypothetical protein CL587_13105 [Alteromonadaceae bacterium]|nr:hypothetical protein [Alteromonadaceae bacterium]
MKIKTFVATFLALLTGSLSVNATGQEPEFLKYYPTCDYEIIDTGVAVVMSFVHGNVVSEAAHDDMMADARDDLFNKALEVDARGIVLLKAKFNQINNNRGKMRVTAELLSGCKDGSDYDEGDVTPLTPNGHKQFSMNVIRSERTITLDAFGAGEVITPALPENTVVSIAEGMYGIKPGDSSEKVEDIFGTPSFTFRQDEHWTMLAYGRSHWITLKDGIVAEARFGSPFFGNELTNFFFFDDRFDYRKWSINGIGKGDIYTGKKQQIFRQGSITLTLTGETYLVNNQQDEEQEATGFVLSDEELMASLPEFTWQKSNEAVEYLNEYIAQDRETGSLDISALPGEKIGWTSRQSGKGYVLINPWTLVEVVGRNVSKVNVSPDFIQSEYTDSHNWHFAQFYKGQPKADALSAAGENSFVMYDVIEVEAPDYLYKVYMSEINGKEQVYSMEMRIF